MRNENGYGKRAIVYARFSPRRNESECESIEAQIEACEAYCEEHGYEIECVFEDRAASGQDEDRPGLWDAIRCLRRGRVLVVHKADRLARNLYLSEWLRREIGERGATLEVVSGQVEGDGPESVLIRQVLDAFAEYERKLAATRTSFAMLRHQATGRRMSHIAPYGWKTDPEDQSRLIEDPYEQATLKTILQWHSEGSSFRGIADRLTAAGVPSRGAHWHGKSINRIVKRIQA